MIAVAIAGIVLGLVKFLFIDNRPGDLFVSAISNLAGHFTVYANGYHESNFRSIREGMTVREVEDILGTPLKRIQWQVGCPGEPDDAWHYARSGKSNGNYWKREVWFRNGIVYQKVATYDMNLTRFLIMANR
jgi:hypothetical protein